MPSCHFSPDVYNVSNNTTINSNDKQVNVDIRPIHNAPKICGSNPWRKRNLFHLIYRFRGMWITMYLNGLLINRWCVCMNVFIIFTWRAPASLEIIKQNNEVLTPMNISFCTSYDIYPTFDRYPSTLFNPSKILSEYYALKCHVYKNTLSKYAKT